MAKKYYSLLVIWRGSNQWSIEFGDYDRECVDDERTDMTEGWQSEEIVRTKVICTNDDQASIHALVNTLNQGRA